MSFIKDLKISTKGGSLKCKIRHIKIHLRWAWQRFWLGYDERDIIDFDSSLNKRIAILLEEMLKRELYPMRIPAEIVGNTDTVLYYTLEQTKAIIDIIIHYFRMANEDTVLELHYGKKEVYAMHINDFKKIESIRKQNQDLAYEHLRMFLDQLWC